MSTAVECAERSELSQRGLIDAWLEVLEFANRPTFILDLTSDRTTPIHHNKVLRNRDKLRLAIDNQLVLRPERRNAFCQWATAEGNELEGCKFAGYNWVGTVVAHKWKIVAGIIHDDGKVYDHEFRYDMSRDARDEKGLRMQSLRPVITTGLEGHRHSGSREFSEGSLPPSPKIADWRSNADSFDWTNPYPVMNLSKHEKFLRSFNWSSTPLGPMESWSQEFRQLCRILTSDCRPAALYHGDQKTIIYNEAYKRVIGKKHPEMLGKTFIEAWGVLGEQYVRIFEHAALDGRAVTVDNAQVQIQRTGHIEEAFFSWAYVPIMCDEGNVSYYNPIYEVTTQFITERRMKTLLSFGQSISAPKSLPQFWLSVLEGLRPHLNDVPFCLLYSTSVDSSKESGYSWTLEGLIGVQQELGSFKDDPFSTPKSSSQLREAFRSGKPTFLHTQDGTLSEKCVVNLSPRGFNHECKSAVILPILVGARALGFLILGINPRRPYDTDYEGFLYVLCRMLGTAAASSILFEEEILRSQMVVQQLSQEVQASEARFRKMADAAPVGMFQIDAKGLLQYANNQWYSITDHPRDTSQPLNWYTALFDEDVPRVKGEWRKLVSDCCHADRVGLSPPPSTTLEVRLKKKWVTNEMMGTIPVQGTTWILVAAYPECHSDGVRITGCITDISRQKWVEDLEKQRTLRAVEMKKRQENFIDMTSHELRNPMGAILHCADEISSSLSHMQEMVLDAKTRESVEEMADAVSTIIHCSEHQKRIIDDILTLSKLESDLLIIAPVEVHPLSAFNTAMKIFELELHKGDVRMDLVVENSFHEMKIDWAKLDTSRLLQVVINLTGNAIKFTRTEPKREIQIIVNASSKQPTDGMFGVEYLPPRVERNDGTDGKEWGTGRPFYLHVAIKDTGRGLSPEERNLMFQRFVQANPRTQVQYGGSGLGLFISKELTERQGGRIGVESEAGVGSTFAFYIKARCCESPKCPQESIEHPISSHDISAAASDSQVESRSSSPISTYPTKNWPLSSKPQVKVRPSAATRHVLIVEDNLVNQKVLSRQMKNIGCDVHVANHGLEAITFIKKSCFWKDRNGKGIPLSVILMDLEMPIMTGLECVTRIRELQIKGAILGHIPVIAVTANARNGQRLGAKESGMDAVVTKPFRIPELVPEMERLVREFTDVNVGAGSWPLVDG